MPETIRCLTLAEIEEQVCEVIVEQLQIPRDEFSPASRVIDDLHCDSLEIVELIMALEDRFDVTISNRETHPFCQAIFTRTDFRVSDLAEAVYIQQGTGKPDRTFGRRRQQQRFRWLPFMRGWACRHSDCITWPETSGNGAATGTTITSTPDRTRAKRTPAIGRKRACAPSEVEAGSARPNCAAVRTAGGDRPLPAEGAWVSAA